MPPKKTAAKKFRILSIDGGGIRGILPGMILIELENELRKRSGDPHARLGDFFDLIAGTSTGGILSCLYLVPDAKGKPRFTAGDAVNLYLEYGDDVFDASIWHKIRTAGGLRDEKYPAAPLEKVLKQFLEDLKLSQLLKPTLITTYDISRRKAHFFTQHDAVNDPSSDFLVRDVARATSAAPTYFEAARVASVNNTVFPLVDGGVFANNPTMCAYAEAHAKWKKSVQDMVILSIGTGVIKKPYDYKVAKDWGAIEWVLPLLDILLTGVAETVHYQLAQIFEAAGCKANYCRIDPELGAASPDMDNASFENLQALRAAGEKAAQDNLPKIQAVAALLTQ